MHEFDKEINVCACLSNQTPYDIENLDFGDYTQLKRKINWVYNTPPKAAPVNHWNRYQFIYDIRKINTGRYISLQSFLQVGIVENLHNLAAVIIKPRWGKYDPTLHEKYAEDIGNAPFIAVYSSLLFFCALFSEFIRHSLPADMTTKEGQNLLILLRNSLDGLFMPSDSQSTNDAP